MVENLAVQDEGMAELEACELRIYSAFHKQLEGTSDIGKELETIDKKKLYGLRGYENLKNYAADHLRMDEKTVQRSINVMHVIESLRGAGVDLPPNESQMAELARLPDEQVVPVWQKLVETCDKKDLPVTVSRIRAAVNLEKGPVRAGVKTNLKIEMEPLSENGERALARIRRVCGDAIATAIEDGTRQLTERAIIKWSELKDQEMKNLIYYVIDQGWAVTEAILYEQKGVDVRSSLGELTLRARARGGYLAVKHEEFLLTLERDREKAA